MTMRESCVVNTTQQEISYSLHPLSPPSLTHSEHTVDEFEDHHTQTLQTWPALDTMSAPPKEDINDVLNSVIANINRITDHLRSHGENEAANDFSRQFTTTFQNLYSVIAPWNIDQCLMRPQFPVKTVDHEAPPAPPLSAPFTTWATIAATAPANGTNGIVKYRSRRVIEQQPAEIEAHDDNSSDRRVIWVQPWEESRSLGEITRIMHDTGPVYSMAYAPSEAGVCIVFQNADSARKFMDDCAEQTRVLGRPPLGVGISLIPGLPYPADADIRRMDPPENARRRLTFARQQLFSHGITEKQFKHDIEQLVGPHNLELLWLFNTGNATVVLSAVPLARLVRETFLKNARNKGSLYQGVVITYSHDPCERDLRLVSQIPGHANYIGDNGAANRGIHNGNSLPYAGRNRASTWGSQTRSALAYSDSDRIPNKRRDTNTKKFAEDEGWQTVKKRR